MAGAVAYNKNNSGVKRIMAEARELRADVSTEYTASPLEEDIFDWHCTIRGPAGTEFEGGLYHARIVLPSEYPFKAPSIMLLTPNGRFELNKKICISFTSYHEDLWQPSWGVRTAIIGLQSFFPLKGEAAVGVGGIEVPVHERRRLAALSRDWVCPHCNQSNLEALPDTRAVETPKPFEAASATCASEAVSNTPAAAPTASPSTETPVANSKTASPSSQDSAVSITSTNLTPPSSEPSVSIESLPIPSATVPVHQVQVPISRPVQIAVSQSVNPSRPMDLTPSTPAARVIPQPAVPHERGASSISRTNDPHDLGMEPRSAPLILDLAIMALVALFVAMLARRFL